MGFEGASLFTRAFWYAVFVGVTASAALTTFRWVNPELRGVRDRFLYFFLRYGFPATALILVSTWLYLKFFAG